MTLLILGMFFSLVLVLPSTLADVEVGISDGVGGEIGVNFERDIPVNQTVFGVNSSVYSDCWTTNEGIKCNVVDIKTSELDGDNLSLTNNLSSPQINTQLICLDDVDCDTQIRTTGGTNFFVSNGVSGAGEQSIMFNENSGNTELVNKQNGKWKFTSTNGKVILDPENTYGLIIEGQGNITMAASGGIGYFTGSNGLSDFLFSEPVAAPHFCDDDVCTDFDLNDASGMNLETPTLASMVFDAASSGKTIFTNNMLGEYDFSSGVIGGLVTLFDSTSGSSALLHLDDATYVWNFAAQVGGGYAARLESAFGDIIFADGSGVMNADSTMATFKSNMSGEEVRILDVGGVYSVNASGTAIFDDLTTTSLNVSGSATIERNLKVENTTRFFSTYDVANSADGDSFFVHRKAAEGDDYLRIFLNSAGWTDIYSTDNIRAWADGTAIQVWYSVGTLFLDDKLFAWGSSGDFAAGYDSSDDLLVFTNSTSINALENRWMTVDKPGNMTIKRNLKTEGNLDVEENFTGNQIYGEMYYHNHTGTSLSFDLNDTWYELYFPEADKLNGFSYLGGFNVSSNLTAQVSGLYQASYMAIGSGQNNHVYLTTILIDGVAQDRCGNHHKMAAGGDVITQGGVCFINISSGQVVSVATQDYGGTGLGVYYGGNLNLVRVGDES